MDTDEGTRPAAGRMHGSTTIRLSGARGGNRENGENRENGGYGENGESGEWRATQDGVPVVGRGETAAQAAAAYCRKVDALDE